MALQRFIGWLIALALFVGCGTSKGPTLSAYPDPMPMRVLIQNVRILDVEAGTLGALSDVLLRDGRVASISLAGAARREVDRTIDGEGGTLLPGLIDMHGHVAASTGPTWQITEGPRPALNLRSYAYSGVTTIFDPGDGSGDAFARRDRVAAREQIGPQIFTVGTILTAPSSHPLAMLEELVPAWLAWFIADGIAVAVWDDESIAEAVDAQADGGADGIKIVVDQIPLDANRMSEEVAAAVVTRADLHGLRVVAHIGTTEDALAAARAGVGLWVHGVYKEPIPEAAIETLVGFGIPMVTTSEVFDSYGRALLGPIEPTRLERETVMPEVLASFYPIPEDFDPGPLMGWVELMQDTREVRMDNVRRLHAAGMTILAGSDTQSRVFPGPALHREIRTLVEAGLTPAQAIRAATLDPARYLTQSDDPDFGRIGVGKRADLLLVEGDPTADIGALEAIREVFLKGVPIDRMAVSVSVLE